MAGATGQESLGRRVGCGEGEPEACHVSERGDKGAVIDVDAGVRLEQLRAEEVGRRGVVSAVSFEEDPLEQLDLWPRGVPCGCC